MEASAIWPTPRSLASQPVVRRLTTPCGACCFAPKHEPASRDGTGARSVRSRDGSESLSGLWSALEHGGSPFSSRRRSSDYPASFATHQPAASDCADDRQVVPSAVVAPRQCRFGQPPCPTAAASKWQLAIAAPHILAHWNHQIPITSRSCPAGSALGRVPVRRPMPRRVTCDGRHPKTFTICSRTCYGNAAQKQT